LITGANRGLGLEFARQYASEGWDVLATCREPRRARELQALVKHSATNRKGSPWMARTPAASRKQGHRRKGFRADCSSNMRAQLECPARRPARWITTTGCASSR